MSTRFYYTATSVALTPAYDTEWDKTANAVRRLLSQGKNSTIATTSTDSESSSSSPYDILNRQLISKPLKAQTISGTVKGQLQCYQNAEDADYCRALVIKVVSSDGGTVRGVLLSHFPSSLTSEFATTLTNRNFPPTTALNQVTCQDGDYLVVEIGVRSFNTTSVSKTFGIRYRDSNTVTDLPEDETSTNDYCGWLEFSYTILFQDSVTVSQTCAQVEYIPYSREIVSQLIAQIEYIPTPPGQYTTEVEVSVTLDPSGTLYKVEYAKDAAVTVTLDPSQTSTQFQDANEKVTDAEVTISLSPTPDAVQVHAADAEVTVTLDPSSTISICTIFSVEAVIEIIFEPDCTSGMPVPGWDPLTGYGLVDFSWLSEDPPFYVVLGDIPLVIDPTAKEVSLFAEDTFDINPDLKVGGRTTVVHSKPGELLVDSQGGPAVGGEPVVEWPEIPVEDYTAKVEILLGGSSSAQHFTPSPRDMAVETRGGVRLTGSTSPTYLSPQDLITEYTTVVAAKVGPVQVPAVEFVEPGLDVDVLEVTTQVSLELSGAPLVDYPELPTVFEHETNFGKIRVGGACGVLWDYPEIFDHVAVGGIILEGQGEEAAEAFYTIALHGYTFEPSLYSNFSFNSYASHRGRMLAARDDGIYVLEGADDDGKPFHPGVRIGPTTFGLDNFKRLRFLHLGDCGDAEVRVAGKTKGKEGYYRKSRGRYEVSREVEDKIVTVEISDFTRLDQTQIDLIVLANR